MGNDIMQQIGKIKCLVVEPEIGPSSATKTIILFHGFGADAYDLQSLSEANQTPWPTRWIFPQGPLEVPIGPGWTGRAWWPIDINNMTALKDLSEVEPPALNKLRPQITEMLTQLKTPLSEIILGGFSQGAMLATDSFLRCDPAAAGLIIFSGNLLCKNAWSALAPKHAGQKFFMTHGSQDMILPVSGAQRLETLLTQAGLKGRLQSFGGGHEIPPQAIRAAEKFLAAEI